MKEYKIIDNIRVYHDDIEESHNDYNSEHLKSLYKHEQKHFWFLARKEFISKQVEHLFTKNSKIIEIGSGTGSVTKSLMECGFSNVSVGDMHLSGLKYAKSYGIENCYQFDLLRCPFRNEFEVVCMFDVLEHIHDTDKALQGVSRMLKDKGSVVLTLPAHNWLWSRDDTIAGHKKRYTKKQIEKELIKNGFEVITSQYFFSAIVPLLLLRRFLKPDNKKPVRSTELNQDISINRYLNQVLYLLSSLEHKCNSFTPNLFGGSLFVVGRKK
ncbi:class I SAM-dependent methyltransferase [Vibrio tubiashii]|uniref:class I SAM-dependent methyltransferase n=1 Tax=Vibrio tubiashii TaxID=29498 RepID=UPI001EFCC16D|nr:class I SAM-dependent methyltransferase [Vibrio tubiashii]MCG9584140.1 class I SAM-dependent methyltransferase [Vibrio tubiashii]MCG9617735.1 class I SAM-dependent methyltransferase [Vibrio tubiashii]MCG9689533.1 class I SAM-dependent methyltransferase [Vibrio tubiashii]